MFIHVAWGLHGGGVCCMEWQEAFIAETCKLLNCDRATLFLVDNVTKVTMRHAAYM